MSFFSLTFFLPCVLALALALSNSYPFSCWFSLSFSLSVSLFQSLSQNLPSSEFLIEQTMSDTVSVCLCVGINPYVVGLMSVRVADRCFLFYISITGSYVCVWVFGWVCVCVFVIPPTLTITHSLKHLKYLLRFVEQILCDGCCTRKIFQAANRSRIRFFKVFCIRWKFCVTKQWYKDKVT